MNITHDRETFDQLTMTIERQVGDIKTMVDEFAEFARMPKPEMARDDLRQAVQEPVVLFRESHPEIKFDLRICPTSRCSCRSIAVSSHRPSPTS